MATLKIRTTWGAIDVESVEGRVTTCDLPYLAKKPSTPFKAMASTVVAVGADDRRALKHADRFIRDLLDGKAAKRPAIAVPESAPFMQRAWKAMMAIPPGRAITYSELAKCAGSPRAVRAAGQACAKNQIPVFIPCHRILAKGGKLGGFSCGLPWKELLLERECRGESSTMKIALACGGTGGHFFPGLATAEVLRERGHEVTLWLAGKNVEATTVKAWSGPVVTVQSQGFEGRSPVRTIETIFKLGRALQTCVSRMKNDRPNVLLAMGSYAAVGPVGAAIRLGIPYVLHEANVYPGRAITMLSRSARAVAGYFDETRYHLSRKDINLTGMPLRRDLVLAARGVTWGPRPGRPFTVLIMGGSKGADALNDIVSKAISMAHLKGHEIRAIHLTGEKMLADVRDTYMNAGVDHEVHAFTHDMAAVYGKADLAICRAGAATCAELCLFGMPALLVPYPHATHDHQTANARAMEKTGAADVVPQKDLGISWLSGYIITCAQTPQRLEKMHRAAKARAVPDAAEALANLVEKVGKDSNGKRA